MAWGMGGIPACTEADPPVNRMTNRCKNITLPQTSSAGGNNTVAIYTLFSDSLGITILELASDIDLPRGGQLWHNLRSGRLPDEFLKGRNI